MLTKKQHQLLIFINAEQKKFGITPSFEEMKDALNLKSKSGIHRLITGLEERGFIYRLPHRARALEVLKLPSNNNDVPTEKYPNNLIKGNFQTDESPNINSVKIPLLGKIAAGTPIEAISDPMSYIDFPSHMAGRGECYALKIEGDSMIDAGIHNGDTALIEKCDNAENGTIVVALLDNSEATLKRIQKKGKEIALEPANKDYKIQTFGSDRVKVQGKLVGLLRTYH